jgi:NitT/TauT family transport system permease protein
MKRHIHFWPFVVPCLALFVWAFLTSALRVSEIILPPPIAVVKELGRIIMDGQLPMDLGWTLLRAGLGFLVGVTSGVVIGAAMGSWRPVNNLLAFPVDALRSIPVPVLLPLFMLFLGWGLRSMMCLIAFPCCWLVTVNTMYGVRNSSAVRKEMASLFRLGPTKTFLFVTLPDALPSIAASVRISVATCLHMAIIGEMFMSSTSGLGYRIIDAHMLLRVPEVYAYIVVVGVLGYVLNKAVVSCEELLLWR